MTDTGQIPGEGQPENAGAQPEGHGQQPGVPAPGTYTYAEPAEGDDELLMPGAHGAWGEMQPQQAQSYGGSLPQQGQQPSHTPGAHEAAGRDSGSIDYGAVRSPQPGASASADSGSGHTPRRPLHLGPPVPEQSGAVRPLSDRGPAPAPSPSPSPAPQPASPAGGPEYLDATAQDDEALPGPQLGELPSQREEWNAEEQRFSPAETVAQPASGPLPTEEPATATAPEAANAPEAAPVSAESPNAPAAGADAAPSGVQVTVTAQDAARAVEGAEGAATAPSPEEVSAAVAAEQTAAVANGVVAASPSASAEDASGQDQEAAAPAESPARIPAQAPAPEGDTGQPVESAAGEAAEGAAAVSGADDSGSVAVAGQQAEGAPEQAVSEAGEVAATAGSAPEEGASGAAAEGAAEGGNAAEGVAPVPIVEDGSAGEAVPSPGGDGDTPAPAAATPAEAPQGDATQADALPAEAAQAAEATGTADPAQPQPAQPESAERTAEGTTEGATEEAAVVTAEETAAVTGGETAEESADEPAQNSSAQSAEESTSENAAEPPAENAEEPVVENAEGNSTAESSAGHTAESSAEPAAESAKSEPTEAESAKAEPDEAQSDQAEAEVTQPEEAQTPQPEAEAGTQSETEAPQPGKAEASDGEETPPEETPSETASEENSQEEVSQEQISQEQISQEEVSQEEVPQEQTSREEAAQADETAGPTPEVGNPAPHVGEPAPPYGEAEREAVHRLMRERRDIRNGFRPDPIPHEVLLRVLEAAHTAPSVGHSQPWDFVVIRSEETRRTMHELANRQREAYAKSLPKARAKQFKELKIEAILDTPVNIVVTADPTRGGRHTLGRHTQPQMAPYSSALAVENLWLAARAEGLGVGWVSFFDEREMVRTLELPEHLEVVAYLCVGYVDEFPPEPELAQAGWSKRRPLSWVVHEESYGRRVLPGAEPHDLLADTVDAIRPLDAKALGDAWERQKRMTKPAGALGMLEIISAQLCGLSRQCPPPVPEPAAVAVFAGDHGVHAQGVTPWPQEVTAQMVANFLGGGAVCNAFANQVGAEVCVVDVGVAGELPATPGLLPRKVRAGTADMTLGPALTREEVKRAIEVGIETARDLVTAGNKALLTGEMGIANTTSSAALISACTGTDPTEVTGRGTGINDETHARKVEVVRRALDFHKPDPADAIGLLSTVGGLEHAAIVGLILGGASLRTPVILDGVSAGAAALVARALAPEALAACIAGHRSAEPGHVAALNKLGLRPLVDLDLRLGEGTGALLALPMVQSAARAMHEVATFDAAGVTEKG